MDKTYWDRISPDYDSEIFDVLKSDKSGIIKSWLTGVASKRKTIGDVGCGIGKWLTLLSENFKEVTALDISPYNLIHCQKKYKGLQNVSYSAVDMSKTMKKFFEFDVILCVNAILTENLSRRTIFFNNLFKNLNRNGTLILVVPSLESALYSGFVLENYNRKNGFVVKRTSVANCKDEYSKFKQGIVNIDKVPTKHYLREELIVTLSESGFKEIRIDKVQYSWNTEIDKAPKSLKAPYPWDWVVMATKRTGK